MSYDNTSRLLYQYASSERLKALILTLSSELGDVFDVLEQLRSRLDIDRSEGVQLDLIGEIVGQPRPKVLNTISGQIFGFDPLAHDNVSFPSGSSPDFGWSGVGRSDKGGRFQGKDGAVFEGTMIDTDYRSLLRARIYSNRADVTVDSIGEFLVAALGSRGHDVKNNSPAVGSISIVTVRPVSTIQQQILVSLAPVAAGVKIESISTGVLADFRTSFGSQYIGLLFEDV